jgi:competence protein ComFC
MKTCPICHDYLEIHLHFGNLFQLSGKICSSCLLQFEAVKGCPNCGSRESSSLCKDCVNWSMQGLAIKNHSLFYYNDFAKNLIKEIKFSGNLRLLDAFKDAVRMKIKTCSLSGFVVIPVPIHERKWEERGFNQALAIAKLMPLSIVDCFQKNEDITQSKRKKEDRLQAKDDFSLKEEGVKLQGKQVLLVDDIYTTGSTIHQIGKICKANGALSVTSFTLFRS